MSFERLVLKSSVTGVKHLVILEYDLPDDSHVLSRLYSSFDKLNCRFHLGETWFFRIGHDGNKNIDCPPRWHYFSISSRLSQWQSYKAMLFGNGIEKSFRNRCLAERGCTLYIRQGEAEMVGHVFDSSPSTMRIPKMDSDLKASYLKKLFGKEIAKSGGVMT